VLCTDRHTVIKVKEHIICLEHVVFAMAMLHPSRDVKKVVESSKLKIKMLISINNNIH
jgi:hypothetical protein